MITSDLSSFDTLAVGIEKYFKKDQNYSLISSVLPTETNFKSILLKNLILMVLLII